MTLERTDPSEDRTEAAVSSQEVSIPRIGPDCQGEADWRLIMFRDRPACRKNNATLAVIPTRVAQDFRQGVMEGHGGPLDLCHGLLFDERRRAVT